MIIPEHPYFEITEVNNFHLPNYKAFKLVDKRATWREQVVSIPYASDDQVFLMLKHYCDELRKWSDDDYKYMNHLRSKILG